MKKLFFLGLASFSLMITSCSSKKVVATTTTVVSDCPWQMGHMTEKTIKDFQLSAERLQGSKVSIDKDIKLELPTEHELDSVGRHNFYQKGIFLPAESVGVIDSVLVSSSTVIQAPKKIFVTFSEKNTRNSSKNENDSPRFITLGFELENSKQVDNVVLLKRKDVSPETYRSLNSKGIKADADGYLRNGNSYYRMINGKPTLYDPVVAQKTGKYKLSFVRVDETKLDNLAKTSLTNSNGYLKLGADYLILDSLNSEVYLNSGTSVYLDQIKFRVCSQLESIRTKGFDD
jgi:hypothetical protein